MRFQGSFDKIILKQLKKVKSKVTVYSNFLFKVEKKLLLMLKSLIKSYKLELEK